MTVLVDTSVWSLALRRRRRSRLRPDERALTRALSDLICDGQTVLIGPIRQEILSGIRDVAAFERLCQYLSDFEDEPLSTSDYENAARNHNRCQEAGVAGSPIDFLICAVAIRRQLAIFTIDEDFQRYAQHLPIALHEPNARGG